MYFTDIPKPFQVKPSPILSKSMFLWSKGMACASVKRFRKRIELTLFNTLKPLCLLWVAVSVLGATYSSSSHSRSPKRTFQESIVIIILIPVFIYIRVFVQITVSLEINGFLCHNHLIIYRTTHHNF